MHSVDACVPGAQLERQKLRDAKHAQLLKDREEGRLLEVMTISQRLEHLKSRSPPHWQPDAHSVYNSRFHR